MILTFPTFLKTTHFDTAKRKERERERERREREKREKRRQKEREKKKNRLSLIWYSVPVVSNRLPNDDGSSMITSFP